MARSRRTAQSTREPFSTKEFVRRAALLTMGFAVACGMAEVFIRTLASFRPEVQFLARHRFGVIKSRFGSLEELAREANLVPHQSSNNHYSNALGFMDREFSIEKPAGTMRIMALGDSFVAGSVAYPQSVLTLVGDFMRRDCGNNIEIMNLGIPGVGLPIYRQAQWLALPRYRPDVVILHFYMGNDGPSYVHGAAEPGTSFRLRVYERSYAWNYIRNSIRVLRSVNPEVRASSPPATAGGASPQGSLRVSDMPEVTDRDFKPTFTEAAFADIAINELGQLYSDKRAPAAHAEHWQRTLQELNAIKLEAVAGTGRAPIIVLYPSELQVYPQAFEAAKQHAVRRHEGYPSDSFDPMAPNRTLLAYCQREGLPCIDVTPALVAASEQSPEPLYRPRDTHWNIRGNRVAATAEAAFLRKELCGTR